MSRTTLNLQSFSTIFTNPLNLAQRCEQFLASGNPLSYEELNGFLGESPSAIRRLVSLVEEALNTDDRDSLQSLLSHPKLKAYFLLTNDVLFLSCKPISSACVNEPNEDITQFPLTHKAREIVAAFLS